MNNQIETFWLLEQNIESSSKSLKMSHLENLLQLTFVCWEGKIPTSTISEGLRIIWIACTVLLNVNSV